MTHALREVGQAKGMAEEEVERVFSFLPTELQSSPAFKDKLTGFWRYEYGLPYAVGKREDRTYVFGTNVAHKVSVLLTGLRVLIRILPEREVRQFCRKLGDKGKHLDFLAELDPISRPRVNFQAAYETQSYSKGKRKIDWYLRFEEDSACLIDVKHRIKALLQHMDGMLPSLYEGEPMKETGAPSPEGIFDSAQIKFVPRRQGLLQGLWIVTNIYYDEAALSDAFRQLNPDLIQFAVLTHFEGDARILARDDAIAGWLKERFCLREMAPRG